MLRKAGTERAFTGEYTDTKTVGVYRCRACQRRAVQVRDQVRLALRLAVVLRAAGRGPGGVHRGHHDGHEARRGPLRQLRLAPGARVRRRLRHADRPALLHQLDQHDAGAGPGVGPDRRFSGSGTGRSSEVTTTTPTPYFSSSERCRLPVLVVDHLRGPPGRTRTRASGRAGRARRGRPAARPPGPPRCAAPWRRTARPPHVWRSFHEAAIGVAGDPRCSAPRCRRVAQACRLVLGGSRLRRARRSANPSSPAPTRWVRARVAVVGRLRVQSTTPATLGHAASTAWSAPAPRARAGRRAVRRTLAVWLGRPGGREPLAVVGADHDVGRPTSCRRSAALAAAPTAQSQPAIAGPAHCGGSDAATAPEAELGGTTAPAPAGPSPVPIELRDRRRAARRARR